MIRRIRLIDFSQVNKIAFTQDTTTLLLGAITGILCGFGAVAFHYSIELINYSFFYLPSEILSVKPILDLTSIYAIIAAILIPGIGGLLVGLLANKFEKGRKGEGIPSVIDAIVSKGGVIGGNVAILKTSQAALSIGTGGAGGKEGPIVQIGAAIGSFFGQLLSLSPDRLKILVGCGAAAGLSAAFNAPLGGALFAMEIILRTFNSKSFSPVIIASVFGTVVSRYFIGDEPAFQIPLYELVTVYEFAFYIVLGVLCGLGSVYFVRVFFYIDTKFEGFKIKKRYLLPAIGGIGVGIIGVFLPGIYGYSYQVIDRSLYNNTPFILLVLLFFFKPVATGLTIGSGGNGGTFAPSMFTGAMLGGAFGQIMDFLFPAISAPPGAYALVGMGAVVAGTTNAALTALIMIFELTNNYKIILPLMLTIIISTYISKAILKGSLYTIKFEREGRGFDIYGRKTSLLRQIPINILIEPAGNIVKIHDTYDKVISILRTSVYQSLIVVDDDLKMRGVITLSDIRTTLLDEDTNSAVKFLIAGDLLIPKFKSVFSNQNAEDVMKILEENDLEFVPVLEENTKKLEGIISYTKIIRTYQNELFIRENEHDMMIRE
ncbi:MAG: chloride channel protein [Ignavibacteriaceae bacterium]|nr:chloride channel protein [Ignavibacteriaceae bacterium]